MDGDEGFGEEQDVALLLGFSQSEGKSYGCRQPSLAAGAGERDSFLGIWGLAGRLGRDQTGPEEECGITEGLGGGVGGWGRKERSLLGRQALGGLTLHRE